MLQQAAARRTPYLKHRVGTYKAHSVTTATGTPHSRTAWLQAGPKHVPQLHEGRHTY